MKVHNIMYGSLPTFSSQQLAALDKVAKWLKSGTGDQQVFRLFGFAGTGKTTIARHLAAELNGPVVYAAYTGKAAHVMQQNGCEGATTIHQLIYSWERKRDGSFLGELNAESDAADAVLIVVDECSMVDEVVAKDLMSFGRPILVLGDPAQLAPVKGEGFFTDAKPDVMLTEVHRQAKNSPIQRLAMDVREGRSLIRGTYGTSRVVVLDDLDTEDILGADQVIAGRNDTRLSYNSVIRESLGFKSALPCIGDRLVCRQNDHRLQIYNGGLYRVIDLPEGKSPHGYMPLMLQSLDHAGSREVRVLINPDEFLHPGRAVEAKHYGRTQHFDFGYALTVHRAQGSQWSNVFIVDESEVFRASPQKWLYTAITRAIDRVTILV